MDRHNPTDVASAQMQKAMNVAGRMGGWSASHWKTAVFGWLAFVIVSLGVGMVLGTKQIETKDANVGQAHRADRILQKAFPQADPQTEIVLVQNSKLTAKDAEFRAAIADVLGSMRGNPAIKNLVSPYDRGQAALISQDGHSAMVQWDMRGEKKAAEKKIDAILATTKTVAARHPTFTIGEAGSVSSGKALDKLFTDQLALAGERSIPITIIVLFLVLGSLVAVGVPLLLALSGVLATIGLLAIPSQLIPMDPNVNAVVLLIGLAVGVDYSLFYIKREREERAAGKSPEAALAAAAATSGRSVLISGFTVLIAMAGLFFAGDKTYLSFAIGTMTVVGIAMLGSLTVLPALLAKLGDRINRGRIPFLHRLGRNSGDNRFWRTILTPALRHPLDFGRLRHDAADRDRAPGPAPQSRAERPRLAAEERRHRRHDPGDPECVLERRRRSGPRRDRGRRELTGREARAGGSEGEGARERPDDQADRRRDQRLPDRRARDDPARRQGRRRRSRMPRWTPCATTSCRPRSAGFRKPSTPSAVAPPPRPTRTHC